MSGRAVINVIHSAFWIATVLGASSPTTTCKKVIIEKAITIERIEVKDSGRFKNANIGCKICSKVGSPRLQYQEPSS